VRRRRDPPDVEMNYGTFRNIVAIPNIRFIVDMWDTYHPYKLNMPQFKYWLVPIGVVAVHLMDSFHAALRY
jgi:hypothetical protein